MYSSRLPLLVLLSTLPLFVACASFGPSRTTRADDTRVRILEKELKRRQFAMEELHERNLILEKRSVTSQALAPATAPIIKPERPATPMPFDPSASMERSIPAQAPLAKRLPEQAIQFDPPSPALQVLPTSQLLAQSGAGLSQKLTSQRAAPPRVLPAKVAPAAIVLDTPEAEASSEDVVQTGEQKLYSKVLETYRSHNPVELQKVLEILLKAYSDSVYADNALYLAGLLAFENGDLPRAMVFMERVMREYPKGNKAVSALFAKAMIEKRQGKFPQAKESLRSVRSLYPGSPEAARAGNEVKFIELASQPKHREG